jgi:hypothetical protein
MKKSKLILTLYISVIALAVASVSMSVAWYAAARNLYVDSIKITIDADRMIEISTSKDDGYTDHIDHTEVEATGLFMPLTSAHRSEWTSQKKDSPTFYDESNSSEGDLMPGYTASDTGYFSQKFYLRTDDDLWITINPEKTFIKANEEYNKSYAEVVYNHYQKSLDPHDVYYKNFSVNEIETMLNEVVKAMRFSLLIKDEDENEYDYVIIDPHFEEETILGGLLDNAFDQYYDSYLQNGTYYERVYGEYKGDPVYDEPSAQDSDFTSPNELPSAFNARHKAGVKTFNLEKSIEENKFEFIKEGAYNLQDFKKSNVPFHFPVRANKPKEVVISLYIEGWDKDSVNYTMGATFFSDLTFKIEREMI